MRCAFDLDDTLIPGLVPFALEPLPRSPLRRLLCREPLRLGTVQLFNELWRHGHEVWIYTTSFRGPMATAMMFRGYGTRIGGMINGDRHRKRMAALGESYKTCTKYPPAFEIDLLVDDSEGVAAESRCYGFEVLRVQPEDECWADAVREAAGLA